MEGQINTEADWCKNCMVVVNTAAWTAQDAQTETSGHVKHCRPMNFISRDSHRTWVIAFSGAQQLKQWHIATSPWMGLRREPPERPPPPAGAGLLLFRSTAFPLPQDQFLRDGYRYRNITHTSSPTEPPSGFSHKEEKKKVVKKHSSKVLRKT